MRRERREWGLRALGVACVAGLCATSISITASSQQQGGKKRKPQTEAVDAGPSELSTSGAEYTDPLADLFGPDGGLATLLTEDAGRSAVRKSVTPLAPPTPEQVKALMELQREADLYEIEAKDYRNAITRTVRQHYDQRRKSVLAGLDRELGVEKKALTEARLEAMRRLQEFVDRYSGPNAQPDASPDAMYRLAALHDEQARDSGATDMAEGLKPAIVLYKRLIKEYPHYRELSGVYYYLGHALNDSNRIDEAQQVWRSLVCHNHYHYPVATDPADADKDVIKSVAQDHDDDYWTGWHHRYPTPESLPGATSTAKPKKGIEAPTGTEGHYRNPFPDSCVAVPQKSEPGRDPRYLAEIWWKIGDWYFDETDAKAGPYSLNRAVTSYHHSMDAAAQEKGVLHGVAMYKLAWTYFKQQRYNAAVKQFVELLRYTDEVEKKTGDPGADFRAEAYTYIAGSLTYVDFNGPGEEEPFIPRTDVLDVERDPRVAEQKMRVGIQRIQDASMIPQDQKWTVEIYKGLAQEYKEVNQLRNYIEVSELILQKWPMYRDAPTIQNGIADTYEELARLSREGTAEHTDNSSKALAARSKLVAYVGNTPWVDANRDDPEALQTAERMVRGGLQRAAADHTNNARAFLQRATETGDATERDAYLERSLQEYRLAEEGWASYLGQDTNAPDAYETRFWLADARHGVVYVKVVRGKSPTSKEVLAARTSAVEVRDSNEDDRYLEPAALYAVDLAFIVRDDQYRVHRETNGARGLEPRDKLKFVGEGENRKVVSEPLPLAVRFLNLSQDEYIQRVPTNLDINKNAPKFRFQIAEAYFTYGQFAEAKKRYEPIYAEECGKSDFGYKAWERLLTMSNIERDVEKSRLLAEAQKTKSCAVSQDQKTAEALLINPTLQEAAYLDARKAYDQAEKMPEGPERQEMWRKAAALYRAALEKAPDRDEAPEAAMNGAHAYKQVGEYDKAIGMYNLFIDKYGDEKTLAGLERGDPKATPPIEPDAKKLATRIKYLKQAHDALSASYVLFFNYRKAAEEYDRISQINRFEQKDRRDAAKNALSLYSNMGDKAKTDAVRRRFVSLGANAEEKAEADYIVARGDMNEWDERGRDEGENKTARTRAMNAMTKYHDANVRNNAASKFVVVAAYNSGKTRKAGGDESYVGWYKKTIAAFEKYKATAPVEEGKSKALSSAEAGMAAESEYALIDAELRKGFDYDSGHHRYQGTTVEVIQKYRDGANDAKKYHDRLQHVIDAYLSAEWIVAARARQGSLYDSLRTGLYNVRPPGLKLFSPKEDKILAKFRESDNPDDQEKADQYEQARREDWRSARDRELASADQVMVNRYVQAVSLSRRYNLSNPAVDRAIQRLAFFTDILGDEKLRAYSQGIEGYTYEDGSFLRSRPGITQEPDPKPLPLPLPVIPR